MWAHFAQLKKQNETKQKKEEEKEEKERQPPDRSDICNVKLIVKVLQKNSIAIMPLWSFTFWLLKISQWGNTTEQKNHTQCTIPSVVIFSFSNDNYSFSTKNASATARHSLRPKDFLAFSKVNGMWQICLKRSFFLSFHIFG